MSQQFLIYGVTLEGKRFRPSDWAERFCGVLSPYQKNSSSRNLSLKTNYSVFARPISYRGEKVVLVDKDIETIEPLAWAFIISFAGDNSLKMKEVDGSMRDEIDPDIREDASVFS